jgi:hypothetical protein
LRGLPLAAAALLAAALASADVYHLTDGDRVTGKTLSRTPKAFRVQTPYGRLSIPRAKVARVVRDDGSEEVFSTDASPTPAPAPPPAVELVLVITGAQFWQAWPAKSAPADPTLRLTVSLDESPLVAYADPVPDPDIPGALVNAMSFAPDDVVAQPLQGALAQPPETRPGRITLRITLPAELAGDHSLRLAYQAWDEAADPPGWRDLAEGALRATLASGVVTVLEVHQDAGRMGFRKRMEDVETFRLEVRTQS